MYLYTFKAMMAHCRKRSGITGFKFDLCRSILDIIEILLYRRINHKLREKPNELNIYLTSQFLHKIRADLHKIQLIYYFRKLIHVFFSIMKWKKNTSINFYCKTPKCRYCSCWNRCDEANHHGSSLLRWTVYFFAARYTFNN